MVGLVLPLLSQEGEREEISSPLEHFCGSDLVCLVFIQMLFATRSCREGSGKF